MGNRNNYYFTRNQSNKLFHASKSTNSSTTNVTIYYFVQSLFTLWKWMQASNYTLILPTNFWHSLAPQHISIRVLQIVIESHLVKCVFFITNFATPPKHNTFCAFRTIGTPNHRRFHTTVCYIIWPSKLVG